ncbi:MAG: hypothetical protein QOJ81_2277 [Chloroflexota bacterium]|jgi:pimeloyl-ACP methyl ester carboxylesterase|nr:hypothetical protein [Chloroflexota bacterium]
MDAYLIHALGDGPESFERFAGLIRHDFERVRVLTLPGHAGRPPLAEMSLDTVAEDVYSEIAADRAVSVLLVGNSLGGVLATLLVARDRIRAAIVNIEGNLTPADAFLSRHLADGRPDTFARVVAELRSSPRATVRRYAERLNVIDRGAAASLARDLVAVSQANVIGEMYVNLSVPRLYIAGSTSLSDPTRSFLESRGERLEVVAGAGHATMEDAPEVVADLVRTFAGTIGKSPTTKRSRRG